MTYNYDAEGNPQPFYQLSQDSGTQLPPTPLSGLIDSTVDPTAVADPLDPLAQSAAGSTAAPATPFGALATPSLSALTGIQPSAPSMMGQPSGSELVNQMFAPQKNNASDIVNQMFAPKGSTATVTPATPKIDPNSWIGQFMGWETKNLPEPVSTGLNSALENVVPGAAGLVGYGGGSAIGGAIGAGLTEAGVGAGIGAFAGLGIGDEVTIPLGAIIGFVGGMAGMFGAQALASSVQGAGLKAVMGDQQYGAYTQMRAQQDQQNPVASLVGQFTGMGMFMRPNLNQLLSASKLAGMFMKSGDVSIFANPENAAGLQALMAVGMGSGSQAGLTALTQIQQGNFQPAQLAASALLGGLFNHNTKLGNELIKYGSLGRIDPNEINRNVDAAKATVEDAAKASTGENAATTRPITTEEHQKAQEAFNAAQANYTALKEAKAPREELTQARGALTRAAAEVRNQQQAMSTAITSQAQSNPAQLQAQLHDQAMQAQAEQLAAREQEQAPHAVENGTTTLRPDEFYHATPNVNSTLYARKFGAGQSPDSNDYSLRLTKDPATAAQHLADVQGGPHPGLVAVKMKDGHTTLGDGHEVTGIPSEVKSIRRYRNASGSPSPVEQGAQLQTPVMQPARMAVVQSRDAIWTRSVAAKESGLHVQSIDPAPENITSLRTELYTSVAAKHDDLMALNYIDSALSDAQRGASLVIGRDANGELVAAASYHQTPSTDEMQGIGSTFEVDSIGSVEPQAGTRLMVEIARTAEANDSGLLIQSHPDARGFYEKLGMREVDKNVFALNAEETRKVIDALDEVTSQNGTVRTLPNVKLDLRGFSSQLQDKMLERAEKMGARQVPFSQVVTGWIFPDGHGLELGGTMIHDDVLDVPGAPEKPFKAFLDEGAIRVATTRGDVAYHTGPTLTNTVVKRIEDNLSAKASADDQRHVLLWSRDGSSRFDVADFINNDFDLQRTIQRTDQTLANLASNTLNSIREQFAAKGIKADLQVIRPLPGKSLPTGAYHRSELEVITDPAALAQELNARTFYHGTRTTDLNRDVVTMDRGDADSLFGPGFYMTEDPRIAMTYGEDAVYEAKPALQKVINAEAHLPADVQAPIFNAILSRGPLHEALVEQSPNLFSGTSEDLMDLASKHKLLGEASDLLDQRYPGTNDGGGTNNWVSSADRVRRWVEVLNEVLHAHNVEIPPASSIADLHAALGATIAKYAQRETGYSGSASEYRQGDFRQPTLGDVITWVYDHDDVEGVAKRTINEVLYANGYEGIYHVGGAMLGGDKHNVLILLSKPEIKIPALDALENATENPGPYTPYLKPSFSQSDQLTKAWEDVMQPASGWNVALSIGKDGRMVDFMSAYPGDSPVAKYLTEHNLVTSSMGVPDALDQWVREHSEKTLQSLGLKSVKTIHYDDTLPNGVMGQFDSTQPEAVSLSRMLPDNIGVKSARRYFQDIAVQASEMAGQDLERFADREATYLDDQPGMVLQYLVEHRVIHEAAHAELFNLFGLRRGANYFELGLALFDKGVFNHLARGEAGIGATSTELKRAMFGTGLTEEMDLLYEFKDAAFSDDFTGYDENKWNATEEAIRRIFEHLAQARVAKLGSKIADYSLANQEALRLTTGDEDGRQAWERLKTYLAEWVRQANKDTVTRSDLAAGNRIQGEPVRARLGTPEERTTQGEVRQLTPSERNGIPEKATSNTQEAGHGYKASEIFQALEARAFGYGVKAEQRPSEDLNGGLGNAAAQPNGTSTEPSAQGSANANPATGGSGAGDVGNATGSGGSPDAGGNAIATGDAGTGDAGTDASRTLANGGTATGDGLSGLGSRDAGSAALNGPPNGPSSARAGGLRAPSLERNDATGSADAEATAGSTGNGQADVRNTPYAQLTTEAGAAGGSTAPVALTGDRAALGDSEQEILGRLAASGINDNALVQEIHARRLGREQAQGLYRQQYRHSVEIDPHAITDPLQIGENVNRLRAELEDFPEDYSKLEPPPEATYNPEIYAKARTELIQSIERQNAATRADLLTAVSGHELIHPQVIEALLRMHEQELVANGKSPAPGMDDSAATLAYRFARYLPADLLDNMAQMGLEKQVAMVRRLHDLAGGLVEDAGESAVGFRGDLASAASDIEEHLDYLIMGARNLGIDGYSHATEATRSYSIWNPRTHEKAQGLADDWLSTNKLPATEAALLDSARPSEPARAAALAASHDYYATRSAADWGGDRASAHQKSLAVGVKRLPAEPQPVFTERQRLQVRTSEAATLPRRPGESDASFADRVAAKGGFSSADHVNRIIAAANGTDPVPTIERSGQTYVKLDTEEYKGTPASQVKGMSAKFRSIVGGAQQAVVDETLRAEPPVDNHGQIAPDKVYADLVQPRIDGLKGINQQEAAAAKAAGKTPPVPLTDQQYSQIHENAHVDMETGLLGTDLAAENGPFDPVAVEQETAAQAATPAVTEAAPTGTVPTPVSEPVGLGADTGELYQRLNRIPGVRYSKDQKAIMASAQKWLNFTQAFNTARALPHLTALADDFHTILTQAAGLHEFDALSADSAVWVNRTVGAINGMNVRVSEAGKKLDGIIGTDTALNDRLTKAIDTGDASGLSPEEAALATLQHHYYQLTGDLAERVKMIGMALEHYLPHLLLKESGGRAVVAGRSFNRATGSVISRLVEDGKQLFPSLDDLEKEFGPGSVERNLAKIFVAHGRGWNSALLYNNLIRKGITDLRLAKTGLEGHNVIIDSQTWKSMSPTERATYRRITTGPMKTGLVDYFVAAPMAERIERLTPVNEMQAPVEQFARNINRLNGWFKEIKFIGPMHIWSMMSNMSSLTSKLGYAGLPPMFDPVVYKIMGRGAEIRNTPTMLARAYEAGIPLPGPGEEMTNAMGVLDRIPVMGKFFSWWHNFMWQKVGHNGMLGVWEYLAKDYASKYQAKHGYMPTGADLKALDAYAADDARRALGFLSDLDMNKDYRLYSNSLLLAAKWSTSQLRVLGDAFGIKFFSELGGGQRLPMGTAAAQEIGANKSAEMARRLLIGGWARLAMTSLVMGGLGSALITGTPSTPVQNFMRDPMHTFDIYAGRDPQTNQDRWVHMPIYMFQREFVDWAMATVRAVNDGKNPIDIATATPARYFSKANPILRTGLETVMGREIGKWMNGYGDNSDIDNDKSIQNIHKSLDNLGIGLPNWAGSIENRLIYAIRSVSPFQAAFPTNPTTPPTGYDLATALGPGTYNLADPRNLASLAGARIDKGTQYETNPQTGQEQSVSQAVQASQARTAQIQSMIDAVKRGDFSAADVLRQQLGLTPGQFKEYVTFGAAHTTDTGLYATAPQQGVATTRTAKITNLFGTQLNTAQQTQYFNLQSHREEEALQMAMNAPDWKTMSSSEHQALGAQWLAFADKISAEQYGQAIGARPGQPITDAQASKMLRDAYSIEGDVVRKLLSDPNYKSAIPQVQQQMMAERQAAAKSAVWQAATGNLKGLSNAQLENMIAVQVGVKDNVTAYIKTLQGYQQAPDIYTRQQYATKAMSWADTMVADAFAGKKADNSLARPLQPQEVWGVVKNGLALQDAALAMLHQSSVYTEALPADQTKLDNTYSTLAHRIALIDQRDNVDLSTQGALYQHGFGQALQSRLMADEGYKQLEDTFGGSTTLQQNIKELSALKARFAQEKGVPTVKLASYNALIQAWYVQNNPQFGAFLNARTLWEQRNPIGQLYAAFNRDELAYAAAEDPLAQQLLDQANSDTAAATLPGY